MSRMDDLDAEAEKLIAEGASGEAFAGLMKRGWRPKSYRQGDGLKGCPSSCGVCFPQPGQRRASRM